MTDAIHKHGAPAARLIFEVTGQRVFEVGGDPVSGHAGRACGKFIKNSGF